jgi:hypothetical protein
MRAHVNYPIWLAEIKEKFDIGKAQAAAKQRGVRLGSYGAETLAPTKKPPQERQPGAQRITGSMASGFDSAMSEQTETRFPAGATRTVHGKYLPSVDSGPPPVDGCSKNTIYEQSVARAVHELRKNRACVRSRQPLKIEQLRLRVEEAQTTFA